MEKTIQPEILPQASTPPNYGPVYTPKVPPAPTPVQQPIMPPKKSVPAWAVILAIIGLMLVVSILFASSRKPQVILPPTPTPTMTPTPTPIRPYSPIASQSAFMQLDSAIASLSASLNAYNVQDPALVPPVMDLPLGF